MASEGGSLLSQVNQLSGRVFARVLKRHGLSDINPGQGRILFALWKEDGLSQVELARRTKLDKSTLALMLERMERQGQVRREADPKDSRIRIVRLPEANKALLAAYAAASREMTDIFYAGMDPSEIEVFESTLRRLVENLETQEAESGRSAKRG